MSVASWRHRFECEWNSYVDSDDSIMVTVRAEPVTVLQGVRYVGQKLVVSDMPWVRLAEILHRIQPDRPTTLGGGGRSNSASAQSRHYDKLAQELRWAAAG